MKKITAVIVEDEQHGIDNLSEKLRRNCPQVEIVGICMNPIDAIRDIPQYQPDLIFLDINLGSLNGFDVLDRLRHISFEIIFTTDYNQYVIDAIRANALDYLLKPIDEKELVNAVFRAYDKIEAKPKQHARIPIPQSDGLRFIDVDEIIYCEANNTRTILHLFNKEKIHTPRVLKQIEEQLKPFNFLRIQRSFLINKDYLVEYHRTDGGYVIMSNGDRLRVPKAQHYLFS